MQRDGKLKIRPVARYSADRGRLKIRARHAKRYVKSVCANNFYLIITISVWAVAVRTNGRVDVNYR